MGVMISLLHRISKSQQRRGMAIISALLAIGLILSLLTAVFGSRRDRGDLLRFDKNHRSTEEAASSMLHYVRFKLEENQRWLAEDPLTVVPPADDDQPMFVVDELDRVDLVEDEGVLRAYTVEMKGKIYLPEEVEFELLITNNFSWDEVTGNVLPHYGTVEIKTSLGLSSSHYLSTLKNAPFSNSTVAASGDISIKTSQVNFLTTDAHRNQIRSEQDVMLPLVENMEFVTQNNWQRSETGTVWSYGDILVGPEDDPLPLEEATDETGARFIPGGRQAYNVPRLGGDQLAADPELDNISTMPQGDYSIGQRTLVFEDASGATQERILPMMVVNNREVYFEQSVLEASAPGVDMATVRLSEDGPLLQARPQLTNPFHVGPAKIELAADPGQNCKISFPADAKVVCPGDLTITGTSSESLPELSFVNPPGEPKPSKGHLEASGDLSLACDIKNAGLLMASGDVNLQPSDVEVAASTSEDVAIYAGRDVNIDASIVTPSAGHAAAGGRKLSFRGLVYAGQDFNFDTGTGIFTPTGGEVDYNRELEVIGSVVAHGEMKMRGPLGASLTYDPEFLDDVMEKSVRGGSKKLEVVSTLNL